VSPGVAAPGELSLTYSPTRFFTAIASPPPGLRWRTTERRSKGYNLWHHLGSSRGRAAIPRCIR